jgi:ankyrin repeat protein
LFLSRGARLNVRNTEGETPLTVVARQANAVMVEHLVERGAEPAFRDANGKTALDHAKTWSHREYFNERNKKLIAQYLAAHESGFPTAMAEIAKREADKRRSVWAQEEATRERAPVADISYPLIMRF